MQIQTDDHVNSMSILASLIHQNLPVRKNKQTKPTLCADSSNAESSQKLAMFSAEPQGRGCYPITIIMWRNSGQCLILIIKMHLIQDKKK